MLRKFGKAAIAVLAVTSVAAACGDDEDDPADTGGDTEITVDDGSDTESTSTGGDTSMAPPVTEAGADVTTGG